MVFAAGEQINNQLQQSNQGQATNVMQQTNSTIQVRHSMPLMYPQMTDQNCDSSNPCEEGLECYSFPGFGPRCAKANPCSYYNCPETTECTLTTTYPASVVCTCTSDECNNSSGTNATYEMSNSGMITTNNSTQEQNIIIWKKESSSSDGSATQIVNTELIANIVEINGVSVPSTSPVEIKNERFVMQTKKGEQNIDIMPNQAMVSTSNSVGANSPIEKVVLSEQDGIPTYNVTATKQANVLFVFPVQMQIETRVSAQNGQIVSINKPWWSFLAGE